MTNIISTEEAERLADSVDQDHCSVAAAIRSLAAERDALREELVTLKSQLEEQGKEIDRLFDELEARENIYLFAGEIQRVIRRHVGRARKGN